MTATTTPRRTTVINQGPDIDTTVINPVDRVRWGPILAGLFTALSTLTVLTLLGLAIGLATFNPNDNLGGLGIGAGIWGTISALLAFGLGGYVAGRTAAVYGRGNSAFNGAMVWLVTIPLLLNLIGGGIGQLLGFAGSAVQTGVTAVAPTAGEAVGGANDDPVAQATAQAAGTAVGEVVGQAQATAEAAIASVDAQDVENATDRAAQVAGGALIPLLLGLAASAIGGALGVRRDPDMTVLSTPSL